MHYVRTWLPGGPQAHSAVRMVQPWCYRLIRQSILTKTPGGGGGRSLWWLVAAPRGPRHMITPKTLSKILAACDSLGLGFDHVRVDVYLDKTDTVLLGEATVHPFGGCVHLSICAPLRSSHSICCAKRAPTLRPDRRTDQRFACPDPTPHSLAPHIATVLWVAF